jgi:hypothetical protein
MVTESPKGNPRSNDDDTLDTTLAIYTVNNTAFVCIECGSDRSCIECSLVPTTDLRNQVRRLCAAIIRRQAEMADMRERMARERAVSDHRKAAIRSADHYFDCVQAYVRWIAVAPRDPGDPNDTAGRLRDASEHYKTTRHDLDVRLSKGEPMPDDTKFTKLVETLRRIRYAQEGDGDLVKMVQTVVELVGDGPKADAELLRAIRKLQRPVTLENAEPEPPLHVVLQIDGKTLDPAEVRQVIGFNINLWGVWAEQGQCWAREERSTLLFLTESEAKEVAAEWSDREPARRSGYVWLPRRFEVPQSMIAVADDAAADATTRGDADVRQELLATRTLYERTNKLLGEAREHITALQSMPPRRYALWDPKAADWWQVNGAPVVWDHEGQARDEAAAATAPQQSELRYEVRPFEEHYGTNDVQSHSLRTRVEKYWRLRCEYYDMWKEDFDLLQEAWRWVSYARERLTSRTEPTR